MRTRIAWVCRSWDRPGSCSTSSWEKLAWSARTCLWQTRSNACVIALQYSLPMGRGSVLGDSSAPAMTGQSCQWMKKGHLVPRRVVGWHATPLADRRVYHLSYKSSKPVGKHRASIELTGDHPVLTERGYVPVAELRTDDRIATGQGLSELARDVVCGTVLGDGCLHSRSSYLTFGHSRRQLAYARFKADLVAELRPWIEERRVAAVAGGEAVYDVVHVRTLAHRALRTLRSEFYRPHKVVPRWLADQLNPRMLAIWFMDDGSTRIRPGGREQVLKSRQSVSGQLV